MIDLTHYDALMKLPGHLGWKVWLFLTKHQAETGSPVLECSYRSLAAGLGIPVNATFAGVKQLEKLGVVKKETGKIELL